MSDDIKVRGISRTTTARPASLPMSLDVGRLSASDAYAIGGLALAALGVAAAGGMLAWGVAPRYGEWAGWQAILFVLGLAVSCGAGTMAGVVVTLRLREWVAYQDRVADYHAIALEQYHIQPIEQYETVTAWDLSPSSERDLLLLALSIHAAHMAGEPTPHSVRSLAGARWIRGERRLVRVGDISPSAAEQAARRLAECGLIVGRGERKAGNWVAQSYDEVIARLLAVSRPRIDPPSQ